LRSPKPFGRDEANRTLGTVARSRGGVEFDAMGGGLVDILFLVVSPQARPGDFLRAEERISWLLVVEDFRDRLRRAGTPSEKRVRATCCRASLPLSVDFCPFACDS
jgi:mannitol/fructose-specific phosphotransferase system IIA component (Ntr-type)